MSSKKPNKKNLPKRKTKEMSIAAAKRLWFAPRSRGRPSKTLAEKLRIAKQVLAKAKEPLSAKKALKKRGRPQKTPKQDATSKNRRGRPRKHPKPDPNKPKRKRGRPPKIKNIDEEKKKPKD